MSPQRPPDNASLIERIDRTESLAILRIACDAGTPAFEPGQFTNVGLVLPAPELFDRRAYSIASAPGEVLELYVRSVPEGRFSPHLFATPVGGRVWIDERAYGTFTLEPVPETASVVLVATDTGIAPFVSMLRRYQGTGRWARCVLLHSARTRADLGYDEEMRARAASDESFSYLPTLTRETGEWGGLRGRVQQHLEPEAFERLTGDVIGRERWHVMLCGNPGMIEEVGPQLVEMGLRPHRKRSPGEIHAERYW